MFCVLCNLVRAKICALVVLCCALLCSVIQVVLKIVLFRMHTPVAVPRRCGLVRVYATVYVHTVQTVCQL